MRGRDTVNAGLSGANTEVYGKTLEQLALPHKAGLAVLTVGTNDLLRKREPDPDAYAIRVERIIKELQKKADLIAVTAIPPVGEDQAKYFSVEAIKPYSQAMEKVCSRVEGCSFHDPYVSMRSEACGTARSGALVDGIHASSYREVYAKLPLCNLLGQAQ